ncbi:MAG: hypothetical protein AMS27_17125 [Bacteroides sp. SM23_62_1]|nr:MAG: hypothetical protein AMS27_17125 [Bacteroides sp. SM23_62_1]
MKKIITLFSLFIGIAAVTYGTVHTVSNNPDIPAQYTSLQAAIDASHDTAGDTILVAGSPTSYGDIAITKKVVIYGAGYNNPYGYNSIVTDIRLQSQNATIGASGSIISGLNSTAVVYFQGNYSGGGKMENVVIERCLLHTIDFSHSDVTYTNDTIRNCLIRDATVHFYYGTYSNVIFHNNIFDSQILYQYSDRDLASVYMKNNVMLDESSNFFNSGSYRIKNMIVQNNIFHDAEPQGCYGCTFNNNITYLNTNDDPIGTDNTGSGNIIGSDPKFKSYTGGGFTYQSDFTLDTGSPGLLAGTDGKNIGTTGGLMPYVPGANPKIPQVTEISFPDNASSVKVGGSLNVTFKAKKQD